MKPETFTILDRLVSRRPDLVICRESIAAACEIILASQRENGKLLACGNGGSAADAMHLVGELMKSFSHPRPLFGPTEQAIRSIHAQTGPYLLANLQMPIRAVSLVGETSLMTAVLNDNSAEVVFAQQVLGLGVEGDVLFAISTSGESRNVELAIFTAKALGLKTVALTGPRGGRIKDLVDCAICAPGDGTPDIQEAHLPIYHTVCLMLETEMFG